MNQPLNTTSSTEIPALEAAHPFVHIKHYVQDPLAFLQQHTETMGDTFQYQLARRKLITTRDPELVQSLLQGKHRYFRKNKAYRKLSALLGDGLFTSEGETWRNNRRMIQPAFHREQILDYFHTMRHYAQAMVKDWEVAAQSGQGVPLTASSTRVTLGIISKTVLGLDLDKEGEAVAKYLPLAMQVMLRKITSPLATPLWLPTRTNRQFAKSVKALDQLILGLIEVRRARGGEGSDLLHQLLTLRDEDSGKGLTDRQLRDEMMTFFLAGHETTAVALTWTVYLLLSNPDWLRKLQQELRRLPSDYRPEDLASAPSLLPVLQESMRLLPPVWILGREALQPMDLGPYSLESGASVIFSPYLVHRHPKYWPDPESFRPERFMEDTPRHKFAYFPFGGGPRLCIGNHFALLELQVLLAEILKAYSLRCPDLRHPGFEYSITLRPARELYLHLAPLIEPTP